jgi:NAD(P)-dependent dehydrogenase (short-subunit alcohol dehydrogenase family)
MSNELEGKTALITGGGRGIGKAIAQRLAAAGALVAVNYANDGTAANRTVSEIVAAGGKAFAVQVKLGSEGAARDLASAVCAEFQRRQATDRIDIIVNNVGGGDYGRLTDMTEEHYDLMMSNNCRAGFFIVKAFYDRINDNGRVINISSVGARLTDPNIIVYTMAKAALDAFTRVLAADLGPRGITVNAVSPGFTAGETNQHVLDDPAMAKTVTDNTALRRFGQPADIADIVHALASPAGRWITAQTIDASGGFKL